MTLDIIVPHYQEAWSVCKPLFDSIAQQRGINFSDIGVIFVNDGDSHAIETVEGNYPFSIKFLTVEHKGVSATRNAGLAESKADYVMFADCDDMFINACGLHLVFSAMKENTDAITSSFIEEQYLDDGSYKLYRHDKDVTFIHGKAYRRKYLVDNDIKFKPRLKIHEDGYFNVIAMTCAETKKEISTPFYMWKWNDNSVVRKNPENFVLNTYEDLMESRAAMAHELNRREYVNEYFDCIIKTVMDSYYDFQKNSYRDEKNAVAVKKAEKAFKNFYTKYSKDYNESALMRRAELMQIARANAFGKEFWIESMTLKEFLNHITKEVK